MDKLPEPVVQGVDRYAISGDDLRRMVEHAQRAIAEKDAEIERLRKLDAEYGRLESAIVMSDPDFDGDSDHPDCISRLLDSIERRQARLAKLEAVAKAARDALAFLKGIEGSGYGGTSEYDVLVVNLGHGLAALEGEKADG